MIVNEKKLQELAEKICNLYDIGEYSYFKQSENGYDDLNIQIVTSQNKYLAKVFSEEKSDAQCVSYIKAIKKSIDFGVNHPQLHEYNLESFSKICLATSSHYARVCLMNFVEGGNMLQSGSTLNEADYENLVDQVSLLHSIDLHDIISDGLWSVTNFEHIYNNKNQVLDKIERDTITEILLMFSKIKMKSLPCKFIHGDLVKTNIIKNSEDRIYIIDFSASGYYPRIQELAVLLTNIFFDENSVENSNNLYHSLLNKYQKHTRLTDYELTVLPLFVMAAHSINIICPIFEKVINKNSTIENEYWINLGRKGVKMKDNLYIR